jgi:serine/threonine-protein kinase
MPLSSGADFAGYTIARPLGSGGMGEVYLAQHPRLPRQDALKVLRPDVSEDQDFRQRFIREADLAAALSHPSIVTVYDRGEFDGQLWIATEYVDGADLAQIMRDRYPAGMPVEEASAVVTAIAGALDYAHQSGMLHRDIKPANILFSQHGPGGRRIALADFGIAREINDSAGMTATNMSVGTVAYAAPEQLMGSPIDGRADQYALAATAFQLLTGTEPFQSTNPVAVISQHLTAPPPRLSQARPDLAPLDPVFATALAKDPSHRYPNCTMFARELAARATGASQFPHAATQAAFPSAAVAATAPTQAAVIPNYLPPSATRDSGQIQPPAGAPQPERNAKTRNVAIAASIAGAVVGASVLFFATDRPNETDGKSDLQSSSPSAVSAGGNGGRSSSSGTDNSSGSRENPMRIGETLKTKDWEIVLGPPREAAAEIAAANQFNKAPEPGMQYWIVPLTVTYTGDSSGYPMNLMVDFVGSDNKTYNGFKCSAVVPDSMLDIGQLYKGGTAKGNKCVTIPAGLNGLWAVTANIAGKPVFFKAN